MKPVVSPSATTTRPRRRRSFAVSLAVAFGLNAGLLTLTAASVQAWRAPTHLPRQPSWVTTVVAPRVVAEPEPAATPPALPADAMLSHAQPALPPPPADSTAAAPKSPPLQDDDDRVVRFYRYREVDLTAEPDSDWNLDTAALDAAGVQTLVFEIFIGAAGEVVACTILAPTDLPAETRSLLEERLRSTTLQPAVRAGLAVASVRRIEMSVQSSAQ